MGPEQYDKDWVDAHQSGAAVTVYYDPSNPENAVLRQGIMWQDPVALAASLAALFLSGGIVGWFRSKLRNADQAGGLPVVQLDEARTAVSLTPSTPWIIGVVAGGVLALVGTILIGVMAPRSFGILVGGLAGVLVASLLASAGVYRLAQWWRRRAGRLLVIDHAAQTLTLPASESGGPPKAYTFEAVYGFEVEKVKTTGGKYIYTHCHVVMATREHGGVVRVQVHAFNNEFQATFLSTWLTDRLGTQRSVEEPRAMAG